MSFSDDAGLWEIVVARAAATPSAVIAIDEDGRTLTAQGFLDDAERAAAGLAALGVGPDVAVSWMLPTWLESAVLVAALARLGAVQNPMLPILGPREMRFITQQTNAKFLIVPSEWRGREFGKEAEAIATDLPELQVLRVDRTLPQGDLATLPPPPKAITPETAPVRWVFYTSGTTADPKGARHTDLTVKASAIGMINALEIDETDRAAMVFPFTHIGGIGWLYAMLLTGCCCIFVEAFVPATTIPVLIREQVTLAGAGTPFHMAYLASQRETPESSLFPNARAFPGGGAPKPPQLHFEVKQELGGVGIVSGYGLTEAPILTMNSVQDNDDQLAQTEGAPTPGVILRLVKLNGELAAADEEGEVRAKGPQMFKGYLDATLDADAFDEEGWFRTGDIGFIDPDGHLRVTGRVKDIIIRHGENISAKELEDLLFTHPDIADVAVIGLPDSKTGERACAIITLTEGSSAPSLPDLFGFLTAAGLAKQKVPEQLEVVNALPRNPSGKVLKHELRGQYSN